MIMIEEVTVEIIINTTEAVVVETIEIVATTTITDMTTIEVEETIEIIKEVDRTGMIEEGTKEIIIME